jgi:hypothetical protein
MHQLVFIAAVVCQIDLAITLGAERWREDAAFRDADE